MTRRRMRFRANGKNHDRYEMKAVKVDEEPTVLNLDEWAKAHEEFWEDAMKNGVKLPITDTLIRHKWPEEKPPISGSRYLVLIDREYTSFIDILFWGGSDWVRFKHNDDRTYVEADDDVTHWWNLPEVME